MLKKQYQKMKKHCICIHRYSKQDDYIGLIQLETINRVDEYDYIPELQLVKSYATHID